MWDNGDELIITFRGDERRFALHEFMNVSYTGLVNPQRITLSLREPCEWGSELAFIPPIRSVPFGMHPLARDLMQRVDAARRPQ